MPHTQLPEYASPQIPEYKYLLQKSNTTECDRDYSKGMNYGTFVKKENQFLLCDLSIPGFYLHTYSILNRHSIKAERNKNTAWTYSLKSALAYHRSHLFNLNFQNTETRIKRPTTEKEHNELKTNPAEFKIEYEEVPVQPRITLRELAGYHNDKPVLFTNLLDTPTKQHIIDTIYNAAVDFLDIITSDKFKLLQEYVSTSVPHSKSLDELAKELTTEPFSQPLSPGPRQLYLSPEIILERTHSWDLSIAGF